MLEDYARISWTVEDVEHARDYLGLNDFGLPKWTEERSAKFLEKYQERIVDEMVSAGWQIIYEFLSNEKEN